MSVEVLNESGVVPSPVSEQELCDLGRFVLERMRVNPRADLAISLVDEPTMIALHRQWMDLDGPTDVMSFPMDELRPGSEGSGPDGSAAHAAVLGDVVLCPSVAAEQAARAGHSQADELLLLTTHGILHLLGFDHAEPAQEREMFDLQRTLLLTFLAQRGRSTTAAPTPQLEH